MKLLDNSLSKIFLKLTPTYKCAYNFSMNFRIMKLYLDQIIYLSYKIL